MERINKKECFLLLVFFGLLVFSSAQSQTPNIALTWSTDTYVPLAYPGKALPTRESQVEIVASIESGTDAEKLIYTWFINDKIQPDKSGKGRQSLEFNLGQSLSQKYEIKVEVSDEKESFTVSSPYLVIAPVKPEVVIETNLDNLDSSSPIRKLSVSSGQNLAFVAQPYFFNIDRAENLIYTWEFGGQEAVSDNKDNPYLFNLKINEIDSSVAKDLSVSVRNINKLIEQASQTIRVSIMP